MIILFHGDDLLTSRKKFRAFVDGLIKKHPEASWFSFSPENFNRATFAEAVVGGTLFYKKHLVVCDNLGADEDGAEGVLEKIKEIKNSEHVFIFLENQVDKKYLAKLIKVADQEKEYDLKNKTDEAAIKKIQEKKLFAVGDGILARENKLAWLAYQRALSAGFQPENIFWTITRTMKNLIMVKVSQKPEELGLHPYVLGKTKSATNRYSLEELQNFFSRLSALWHDNFFTTDEFSAGLERILLEI